MNLQYGMNVCLMNDSFPPTIDGVANCVKNYADIIENSLGHALVCTPHYPRVTDEYPYPVLRYPSFNMSKAFGYRAGMPFDRKTIEQLRQWPIDVIHAHCPIMSMIMARTVRELVHRPIILTYHSKFDIDIQQEITSAAVQEQATRVIVANIEAADAVWTVSEGASRSLRNLGYTGEYRVMQNGVDLPLGAAAPEDVRAIDTALGLNADIPLFLFIGRMMWYKGIRQILDAVRLLKAENLTFRMLFVGDGLDKEEIIRYAEKIGVCDRAIFLPAVSDRNQLRAYYSRGDLFLFPSTYDTNGLVVHEAAACGTASITLTGSCAAENVIDGHNGLTVDETPEDLARVCRQMLAHPETMRRLGDAAQSELYLSWDDSVRRAYAEYANVCRDYREHSHPARNGKSDHFFRTVAKFYKNGKSNRIR